MSWVVEGVTVASGAVEYGTVPSYSGATPTKAEDEDYTYAFTGWSPAVVAVTGNATYTATFSETPKEEPEEPGEFRILVDEYDPTTVTGFEGTCPATITAADWPESVTYISAGFDGCTTLKHLTLPAGLQSIGWRAFQNCTALETVDFSNCSSTLSEIGVWAFCNCTSLRSLDVNGNRLVVGHGAFYACSSLAELNLGSGVDTVEEYAFGACKSLATITSAAAHVDETAFIGTAYYKSMPFSFIVKEDWEGKLSVAGFKGPCPATIAAGDWPEGVETIYDYAFTYCDELRSVEFPASFSRINAGTFAGCKGLESITFPATNEHEEGLEVGHNAFALCTNLYSVTLRGPLAVSMEAFGGCSHLETVVVEEGVHFWGDNIFARTGVRSIVLPENMDSVSAGAFAGNDGVFTVYVPRSVEDNYGLENGIVECEPYTPRVFGLESEERWAEYGFTYQETTTNLRVVPYGDEPENPDEPYEGTETINGITWSYTVSNGVATITGANPDYGNLVVPDVVEEDIPVTAIEDGVFADCNGLESVTIGRNIVRIGDDVGVKTADWAERLAEEGFDGSSPAFGECESLMNFYVAEGNTVFESIGGALYYRDTPASAKTLALYPSGRSTLYFADGLTVTKIGDGACAWCHQFTEMTIPASVREIGVRAFDFCREMTSLVIPSSVTNIGYGAFLMNIGLENVEISGTNLVIGDYAFYHGFTSSDGTTLVLNEGIASIGRSAFQECWNLVGDIVIPEGVTSIGRSAFSGACDVSDLSLPDTLTFIGAEAFCGCSGLTRLVVPLSVEEIEIASSENDVFGAFANCFGLTKIYMPSSLKPATDEATLDYLADVFYGLGLEGMPASERDAILTWYSDPSEIGGGDEPETYTITWVNWDGTTLETDENVAAGATPSYDGATPTKAETAEYTYTFSGWTPSVASVTGNATYTATFDATPKGHDQHIDLSTLTEDDYVVQDGDILTGTTGYYVMIADGATITLAGATINNCLHCEGSATIQLADGTDNIVRPAGNGYGGIRIGRSDTTLTIVGDTGTLTAIGDRNSPGIGNVAYRGGNIVIAGGVITATGGESAPGIGSADGAVNFDILCGTIEITGGTVVATGGKYGAGIGGDDGWGTAGDITIGGGISRVVATRGERYQEAPIFSSGRVDIAANLKRTTSGYTWTLEPMTVADMTWMAVDLRTGAKSYYGYDFDTATNTFNTVEYKTVKMAFRRVPKGEYFIRNGTKTATMERDYYIALFETTKAQYDLMLDPATNVTTSSSTVAKGEVPWTSLRGTTEITPQGVVTNVEGDHAICNLNGLTGLKFDLPTIAMWEVASLAKPTNATATAAWSWFFGPTIDNLAEYAWNDGWTIHEAGLLKPNEWGLYDVYGNVWEWCADGIGTERWDMQEAFEYDWKWTQTPNGDGRDPSSRHCAGGSVCESSEYCNSVKINTARKESGYQYIGFRLAVIVDDETGGGGGEEPEPEPPFTTGGDAEWYVEGNDGVEPGAWRSGAIGHSNSTWIETTVTGPCLVSFQWRVSSEEGYDKLHLTVDGEERDPISGSADWDNVSLTFRDAGSHTIRWTYLKDSSVSNGEDCGWVKGFTETPKTFTSYTVTWKNWDGTVLDTDSVLEDDMPEYTGTTPTRPKDDEYTYVFNGWSPDIVAATGNVEYTATYTALPNLPASVTTGGDAEWFVDTDGSWRSGTIMNSQETWIETTVTGPCLVTFSWKASSEGGGYDMLALAVDGEEKDSIGGVMSDWVEYSLPIPESGAHTVRWKYFKDSSAWEGEDCGWVKDFTETPKTFTSYTVTWKNWDGTVLGEDSVVEGFMPQYRGETPARATDEDYYYTFAGWTPVVASVTGDTIYTATYNAYQARFEMVMDGTTVTGYIGIVPKHITLADWPEGVTAVADDVFSGYSIGDPWIIESVEIPATVETLGQRAFYNAYGLTNLVFEAGGTQPLEIGLATFAFAYSLESVALPARLASIGGSGFYQAAKLAAVTFLGDFDSVEIAQDAFKGTPYYATLPFKMILMEIDGQQKVVSYQGTLPKVITAADWPAEATAVAGGSLGWNSIVKDITIPATITSVDAQAFFRSEELTNVVFAAAAPGEDPVPLAIEESAFGECYKLRSVTFRDGLSRIAGYAFYGCPLLAEINFPPSGTEGAYIADSAFAGTEYESNLPFMFYVDEMNIITGFRGTCPPKLGGADGYPWPEGVECIGSDAFSGCTTLEHVTLPAGITAVALGAFRDCRNLATANFAPSFETLLSIGGEAFSGCTSLETVELDGDGLYVDRGAFEGCSSLTTLTLGAGVSKVDEYAFAYTTRLEAFVNNSSADIDETAFLGSGYYKNMPFSFITKREYGSLVIAGYKGSPTQINAADWPAGVTYVNRRAFTFCPSLRAIEFPAHIEYIDEGAFACCTNLVSITFPERSELYVGHNAFALCTKLQNVTLKSGMDIDEDVFAGCASLETVIVEEGVGTIGAGAFARTLVRSIVLPEGVHWVYNDSFAGNDGDFTLYIPRNADGGNYGVSSGSVAYEYIPRIFGLETEEGWARYGLVVRKTTTNLRVVPYCRVTLDLDGGTGVATSQLGTGETVNDQFPHPVKAGFAFAGWTSARVAEITNDTTWTAIIGSATGMEATLTALWTPNEEPETPEIVIDDVNDELKDKVEDVVVDNETGVRMVAAKPGETFSPEEASCILIKSPINSDIDITAAYRKTIVDNNSKIVIELATPEVEPVAEEENKEAEDATGLLEDVAKVDDEKIAAMPEPDVSDPDPEKREEVGALPIKMYPGLYYQASWGDDLGNLTPGAKFRADGVQTHIGVIKQTGSRGFYKISVSER